MSTSCPGPDGYQNIMTSVSYSFPHGLIERRVIIKWFYRLYCIVSHKIQCTNGKLKYILVNKMGTTLTEEYGTTTSTTSTTAAITNLLYLEGYSLCLTFWATLNSFCGTSCGSICLISDLDLMSWKREKELEGKQFWRFLQFVEAGLIVGSHVRSPRIKLYYFWLGSHVLLTESNLSDQYFVD